MKKEKHRGESPEKKILRKLFWEMALHQRRREAPVQEVFP